MFNFGQLAVEYYLSTQDKLLKQIKDMFVLPAMVDTDGGLGFSHNGNLYCVIVNTYGEFEVSVISKDQDLAYIELGDATELVKFFELLSNDTQLKDFAVWFNFLG